MKPVRLAVFAALVAAAWFGINAISIAEERDALVAIAVLTVAYLALAALLAWTAWQTAVFKAYAADRGFTYVAGEAKLPMSTEVLSRGRKQWTEQTVVGELSSGVEAVLALFVYEVLRYRDPKKGRESTTEHKVTVIGTEIPELRGLIGKLTVQPRRGYRLFDSVEDAVKDGRERIEVESVEFDRRYEVFAGVRDDENKARQVLSPAFVVWLTEQRWDATFEVEHENFVLSRRGHLTDADDLDSFWEHAGAITKRLRDEALETTEAKEPVSFEQFANKDWPSPQRGSKRAAWVVVIVFLAAIGGGVVLLERNAKLQEETSPEAQAEDERIDSLAEEILREREEAIAEGRKPEFAP